MLANCDFEFDIARIFVAHNFDDYASRLIVRRRLRRDFCDHNLIESCRVQLVARNQNVLIDSPFRRDDEPLTFFTAQLADDAMIRTLQDRHDLAIRLAIAVEPGRLHGHTIAM